MLAIINLRKHSNLENSEVTLLILVFFFKVKEVVTGELDKFAGSDNQETFFTPAERVYLLEICLESVQYDKVSSVGRFCLYPSALVADAIIIPIVECSVFYATIQFSLSW